MSAANEERFWSKVDKSGDCWVWTGPRLPWGYGMFLRSTAHRYVYVLSHGPLPRNVFVCHTCDNPPCVNPAHLFAGSSRDNQLDRLAKGRWSNQNSVKTCCKNGHPFNEANTYVTPQGWRQCRICQAAKTRRLRLKRKEANVGSE